MNWIPFVFAMEAKKTISYRAAFWIKFILGTVTEISIAYFLWGAIFSQSGSTSMQGFSFHGILFYYIIGSLSSRVIQGVGWGEISEEIYNGSLTRYLLYPLSYVFFRYVATLSQQFLSLLQFSLGLLIAYLIWGFPSDLQISATSLLMGSFTALLAGVLMFVLTSVLELVAFWQDTVWNLMAMLRFIGNLLGGLMVPLSFFPEWGKSFVQLTPFPLMYSFPIRSYMGLVSFEEWCRSALLLGGWILFFSAITAWVWRLGISRYTGVGV